MVKQTATCSKCKKVIIGDTYAMPRLCEEHLEKEHPSDFYCLKKLRKHYANFKTEFGDLWLRYI